MRKLLAATAVAMLLVPALAAAIEKDGPETATQGEFAILFAQYAKLNPQTEYTGETAIDALKELGIEPLNGWDAAEPLTEGTMVFLLRFVDIPVFTAEPDRLVTMNEARAIFERFQRILIDNLPALRMLTMETATTHSVRALGNPAPPAPPVSP